MTVDEALEFFEPCRGSGHKLQTLSDVGLGYIHLGQSATTLSGGEAQRVKLATELSRRDHRPHLYILDEPTTGLHFEDVRMLLEVLHRLVDRATPCWSSSTTWTWSRPPTGSSTWGRRAGPAAARRRRGHAAGGGRGCSASRPSGEGAPWARRRARREPAPPVVGMLGVAGREPGRITRRSWTCRDGRGRHAARRSTAAGLLRAARTTTELNASHGSYGIEEQEIVLSDALELETWISASCAAVREHDAGGVEPPAGTGANRRAGRGCTAGNRDRTMGIFQKLSTLLRRTSTMRSPGRRTRRRC
jgi:hypothetical protein